MCKLSSERVAPQKDFEFSNAVERLKSCPVYYFFLQSLRVTEFFKSLRII